MRRLTFLGAWLLVLVLTTTLAWQIVSAADDRVSDRPNTALNVAAPALDPDSSTSTTVTDPTTTVPDPVPTAPPTSTSTPSSSEGTSSPTTINPGDTTSTAVSGWTVKTIPTAGGTLVVKFRPDEVVLQTATPAAGFQAEVEHAGPPKVEVEFESESARVEVHVEWKDGDLGIEIGDSDHG